MHRSKVSTRISQIALIVWALMPGNGAEALDNDRSLRANFLVLQGDPLVLRADPLVPRGHFLDLPGNLDRELPEFRLEPRGRESLRHLIGSRRWQKLFEARYLIDRYERDNTTSIYDWRDDYTEARRALRKSASKAVTELAIQRLGLDDVGSRIRSRRKERFGMSLSPRAKLGGDPGLGVKLRLRSSDPVWSRLFLEVNQRFESGELGARLVWRNQRLLFELSHTLDDRQSQRHYGTQLPHGDRVTAFALRLTF